MVGLGFFFPLVLEKIIDLYLAFVTFWVGLKAFGIFYPVRWVFDVSAVGAVVAPGMIAVRYRGLHE